LWWVDAKLKLYCAVEHRFAGEKKTHSIKSLIHVGLGSLLGFQNCIMRPNRFVLLLFDRLLFPSASLSNVTSMDSLLLSPWELLMSRLRDTRLDRRRPKAAEETEDGRCSRRLGCDMRALGMKALSRVIVEVLEVSEGMS
jgi:hypothetical protein